MNLPPFLRNPYCYIALTLVGLQFISGVVLDLMIGGILVGMLALAQKD